jgi:hypothetical protein
MLTEELEALQDTAHMLTEELEALQDTATPALQHTPALQGIHVNRRTRGLAQLSM